MQMCVATKGLVEDFGWIKLVIRCFGWSEFKFCQLTFWIIWKIVKHILKRLHNKINSGISLSRKSKSIWLKVSTPRCICPLLVTKPFVRWCLKQVTEILQNQYLSLLNFTPCKCKKKKKPPTNIIAKFPFSRIRYVYNNRCIAVCNSIYIEYMANIKEFHYADCTQGTRKIIVR